METPFAASFEGLQTVVVNPVEEACIEIDRTLSQVSNATSTNSSWQQLPIAKRSVSAHSRKSLQLSRHSTLSEAISEQTGFSNVAEICDVKIGRESLRKVRPLGEGAFAEVHLAEIQLPEDLKYRPPTPPVVAVKNLKKTVESDDILDFINEVTILKELDHDNIIKLVGVGSKNDADMDEAWKSMYMVQEYANGGSLKTLLMRQMMNYRKPLYSFNDALRWCLNIAEALNFLHSSTPKIIHRDMKLDNILLVGESTETYQAKLADFGLHTKIEPGTSQSTDDDALVTYALTGMTGAYIYMAPEVLHSKCYDQSVDVFSFGVIMFELFSRMLLCAQYSNRVDIDESLGHAERVAAGWRPPFPAFIPEVITKLIDRCWSTEPKLRPSMQQVLKELNDIKDSGVVDAIDVGGKKSKQQGCCTIM